MTPLQRLSADLTVVVAQAAPDVVGVTTAVAPLAQGIGSAVPAETAHRVAAGLIRRGRIARPVVGIAGRADDLPPSLAQISGQGKALRVVQVEPATPADRAGLQAEDLLKTDGAPLGSVASFQQQLVLAAGREVVLHFYRNGRRSSVGGSAARPSGI